MPREDGASLKLAAAQDFSGNSKSDRSGSGNSDGETSLTVLRMRDRSDASSSAAGDGAVRLDVEVVVVFLLHQASRVVLNFGHVTFKPLSSCFGNSNCEDDRIVVDVVPVLKSGRIIFMLHI